MTPTNPMVALRNTANELLNADGIYPILDYGWDNQTHSPEYIGLAMWTTDAPFELDFNFWHRTVPPPRPTEQDEIFHTAGEDFIGTMELARNSIGLTRYSWEQRKPDDVLDDEETFWEYRASAAIWLNICSDRVRDYFVMARFGVPTGTTKSWIRGIVFMPGRSGCTRQAKESALGKQRSIFCRLQND
jgi:hypothetical protein